MTNGISEQEKDRIRGRSGDVWVGCDGQRLEITADLHQDMPVRPGLFVLDGRTLQQDEPVPPWIMHDDTAAGKPVLHIYPPDDVTIERQGQIVRHGQGE